MHGYHEKRKTCLFGIPLLDPRASSFLVGWDCCTLAALVYTALVTPYEVSFLTDFSMGLFVLNRVIDVIFSVDIFISFCTMIPPSRKSSLKGNTAWQTRPSAIAHQYMGTWFTIDLISVVVSAGDWVNAYMPESSDDGALLIIQLLRVVRLLKMVRLLRGFRMWKRWETRNAVNYRMLKLMSCMVTILVSSHWIACIWALQTLFKAPRHESWLGRGQMTYCDPDETGTGSICVAPWQVWTASMHFSIMTITSIGYGDIVPTDTSEQIVGLMMMLLSGILWASTIGTLCTVLAENPETVKFHEDIDALNSYMQETGVAQPLRQRLREFFHRAQALRRNKSTQGLLTQMPPALLAELVLQTNGHWLNDIPLLRAPQATTDLSNLEGLDAETRSHRFFLVEVMLSLVSVVYSPNETVNDGYLSVITDGLAFIGMSICGTGKSFGEDALLSSRLLRRRKKVVAISYLSVYMIEPDAIHSIAAKYPHFQKQLRRRVVSLAFRRLMSHLAATERETATGLKLTGATPGAGILSALHRLQHQPEAEVTPPNHAYRAQQMLDTVIYDTVSMMANEQQQMRQDMRAIMKRLDAKADERTSQGTAAPAEAPAPAPTGALSKRLPTLLMNPFDA